MPAVMAGVQSDHHRRGPELQTGHIAWGRRGKSSFLRRLILAVIAMSFKAIFLIIVILLLGAFLYLKYEAKGDPNSHFNQTTRLSLARHPFARALLGLHNEGDARSEYLQNTGPLVIEWFLPITESVDSGVVQQFADLAGKYTGRQVQVNFGGNISVGTIPLVSADNLALKGSPPFGSSVFYAVFATDYQPRDNGELFTTHGEATVVISLNANRKFLGNISQDLNNYLLFDLLHAFGSEIGLPEQGTDPSCVMSSPKGFNGLPLEDSERFQPQDFCPAEQQQIAQLKLQY